MKAERDKHGAHRLRSKPATQAWQAGSVKKSARMILRSWVQIDRGFAANTCIFAANTSLRPARPAGYLGPWGQLLSGNDSASILDRFPNFNFFTLSNFWSSL